MPLVLPDFGTNIKNGHEERIKDHEPNRGVRERDAKRRKSRV